MNTEKDVLTEADVALILDCETSTIQEKARNGELPGLKFGRGWIFPRLALIDWLNKKALEKRHHTKPVAVLTRQSSRRSHLPVLPNLS
jgi:excisionase family DNA binding protein